MTHVDHADSEEARRKRDTRVSLLTGILGLGVLSALLLYNLQPCSVWALTTGCSETRSWEEYLLVNMTGLFLFPMGLIMLMPREGPHLFGFWRPVPGTWRIAGYLYLLMLVLLVPASRLPAFTEYYPLRPEAAYSWPFLVYFELTYGLYMFCWEFFFRGFLTFGLARRLAPTGAILLQALAFGVMHLGKPAPEMAGSFVAGVVLGWLAYRARSFFPCFALHWLCALTFDLLVIQARPGGIL